MHFSKVIYAAVVVAGFSTLAKAESDVHVTLPDVPIDGEDRRIMARAATSCGSGGVPDIDNGYAVPMSSDGSFSINMNRAINPQYFSVGVDASGSGSSFTPGTFDNPGTRQSQVPVRLPAGTKCSGGRQGNRCIISISCDTLNHQTCIIVEQTGSGSSNTSPATGPAHVWPPRMRYRQRYNRPSGYRRPRYRQQYRRPAYRHSNYY
ncbi:hypothetical protein HGRIS_005734 [Hohenbuehelia grisea]|uniref:Uncharacterized protein n=1 Tax=Hohenbuehelia grisea TaxID=104357 RepID=A0ABR3JXQ8_9AGAR